ncbi:rod shape-determining protein MreD [Paracoccus sp. Z118]|uniref:rod shape-determining protein MreD n=1 Tax=Paracoccus sp. Z118 TaxID=2851017 RepID=UPI001C2B8FD1|nr:rod shape-determining protein MreD [Paracoccus sp. Z118]MBV0893128.1 rod shape-determining protein MreD [Paracoccus sp. Z118]
MIDPTRRRQVTGTTLYVVLGLGIIILRLLPLAPGEVSWPGPDVLLCLTLAWAVRRPEQLPVLVIAALFLIENLLLLRPIGLWAAIVVVGTEAVRARERRWRDQPFLVEWLRIGVLVLGMMMTDRLLQLVFFVPGEMSPRPPLGQALMQVIATIAAYPVVVLAARWLVGLRRAAPRDIPGARI